MNAKKMFERGQRRDERRKVEAAETRARLARKLAAHDAMEVALRKILSRAEASEDQTFTDWPQVAQTCRHALLLADAPEAVVAPTHERETRGLNVYTVAGRKYRAHVGCRDGFNADRANGLVYPPTLLRFPDGTQRFAMNREEASMLTNRCAYCGGA